MGLPALLQFENYEVRVIDRDGEPWWVLGDVCRALEVANAPDVASRLDEDEKDAIGITDSAGRPNRATIISEPGLYKILSTSRNPVAKRFDRWVRHEVLPSIRKTGSYGTAELAQMIVDGMKEAMRPLAIRFDGQDRAIERIERRQDSMAEDLAAVKARILNGRKKLKEATKVEHIDAVARMGGYCPCCRTSVVVINGEKSSFSDFDHFYQNSRPDVDYTWLICKPCHNDLTYDRIPRHQREAEFRAYQQQRGRLPGRQAKLF